MYQTVDLRTGSKKLENVMIGDWLRVELFSGI